MSEDTVSSAYRWVLGVIIGIAMAMGASFYTREIRRIDHLETEVVLLTVQMTRIQEKMDYLFKGKGP